MTHIRYTNKNKSTNRQTDRQNDKQTGLKDSETGIEM